METEHFIIQYEEKSDGLLVAEIGEKYYQEVSSLHAYHQDKKIPIIIHNRKNMSHATLLKYDNVPMGFYSSGVIQVLSPAEWVDKDKNIKEHITKHEKL